MKSMPASFGSIVAFAVLCSVIHGQDITDKKTREKSHGFPKTAFEYAKMAEPDLGVPPTVDLAKAVEIPLYVNGIRKYGNLGRSCDNPTFLGKDTISGSVLQRYEGRTANGKPLKEVVWVSFGRNSSDNSKMVIGSVQMIGYNQKSGATAFFESSDRIGPWVSLDDKTLRMRGVMPTIHEPDEFNKAFRTPGNVQCVQCHQADPFITNSFINAAKIPGTDESVVPKLDRESPYYVIGGENWDMRTIHIKGNSCFECHRVGMTTMTLFMNNGWKPNEHMPPHKPGSLSKDVKQLIDAWKKGPEKVAAAEWIIPPARGKRQEIVGDDYAFKATFNLPGSGPLGVKMASTKTKSVKDWEAAYQKLLKSDPSVKAKIESGAATKQQIIDFLKWLDQYGEKGFSKDDDFKKKTGDK
ncbi:MAG: hypothetical protein O3A00_25630 [Planctomycetota bacterium]|nr:hypothetical protein [Planctomycetota bacterium]